MRRFWSVLLVGVLACGKKDATAPQFDWTGTWKSTEVNGAAMPQVVAGTMLDSVVTTFHPSGQVMEYWWYGDGTSDRFDGTYAVVDGGVEVQFPGVTEVINFVRADGGYIRSWQSRCSTGCLGGQLDFWKK